MKPEQTLFRPDDLEPRRCTACNTTRPSLCRHDADISEGLISATRRRPRACLKNTHYDPRTAPFPDGY